MQSLILTALENIPLIRQGDNLADIVLNATNFALLDNDIFVLAQKIVSKAEGRMVNLADVKPSQKAIELAEKTEKDSRLVELMLQESNEVVRYRKNVIVVEHKLGFICANAGIDHSNVSPSPLTPLPKTGEGNNKDDYVLLLPENPDKSAKQIRDEIKKRTNKNRSPISNIKMVKVF
ncbi:MAG: coenzyme F420-0:L-glutamate ligase [Anaerolineales bacterium]|nr:coenzyme F420-0:L-glutamate ligase [Anaerolineales bacterium]